MALAQPNQFPVPAGLLCMVQSWTWVKDAAPAMPATASMMTACTTDSPRRAGVGVGVVDVLVFMGCASLRAVRRVGGW